MQQNIHANRRHKTQYKDHSVGPQPLYLANLSIKNVHYFTPYNTHLIITNRTTKTKDQ